MPANNVAVYAKWAPDDVTVTFDLNGGTGSIDPQIFAAGNTATEPPEPTKADFEFAGWTLQDGTPFNFATPIKENTTLKAHWIGTKSFTVTYHANDDAVSGNIADAENYADGSYAKIASASGLTRTDGKVFLSWNTESDGTGTSYYPGSSLEVKGNTDLYARWGSKADKVSLTYNSNYPSASGLTDAADVVSDLDNNGSVTLKTIAGCGFTAPSGYYFAGWSKSADSTTADYAAGAAVRVDNIGADSNNLYAVWAPKQELVVTITGNSDTVTYNGQKQSATGITATYSLNGQVVSTLPDGVTVNYNGDGAPNAEGTDAGTYQMGLSASSFTTSAPDAYDVQVVVYDGSLTIDRAPLTVTTPDAQKIYNEEALTAAGTISGFVNNETAIFTTTGTQTDVGESTNTYSIDWTNQTAKASNYSIIEDLGTLSVTANNTLAVSTENAGGVYNGSAYTLGAATAKIDGKDTTAATIEYSTDGGQAWFTALPSRTNAGTTTVQVRATKHGYTTATATAAISVTKRNVTLTTANATKEYDGDPLTAPEVTIGGEKFVQGEATVAATGTITDVGQTLNTIGDIKWAEGASADNYNIADPVLGTLTITVNDGLTVSAANTSEKYNGSAHTLGAATAKIDGKETTNATIEYSTDGGQMWSTALPSRTNAGTTTVQVRATKHGYTTATATATITVTRRNVTLTTASAEKPYDETPLTASEVTVGEDGFVPGEATVAATGTITDVGHTSNTIGDIKWAEGASADNYNIADPVLGTLTITDNQGLTVSVADAGGMYKGSAYTLGAATAKIDGKDTTAATIEYSTDGGQIWSTALPSRTNAGTTTVQVRATKHGYTTATATAAITVTKRSVTLTSASDHKTYDKTPLTNHTVNVGGNGFVTGQGASYDVTGTITNVGKQGNTFTYVLNANTNEANYDITTTTGQLTITPAALTVKVTGNSDSKVYNKSEQKVTGFTTDAPDGVTVALAENKTAEAAGTNVGTYNMGLTANDFTVTAENYTVTLVIEDGQLTITPASLDILVTGDKEQFTYDGKLHGAEGFDVTSADGKSIPDGVSVGLAGDHTASVTAINAGTYPMGLTEDSFTVAGASNYNVKLTVNDGSLKIAQRPITITAGSKSKIFDNLPLTFNFASLTNGTLADNQYAVYSASGTITNPGTEPNVPDVHIYIMEAPTPAYAVRMMAVNEPVEVTDNYQIERVNGVLEVTAQTPTPNPPAADKYTLTINYVDQNGKTVADAYANKFNQNDPYSVDSPIITGYELVDSTQATVAGSMPGQNLTVTVVYKKTAVDPQNPKNPKNPTTPTNNPQSDKSADTGDGFSLITWMLLAMIGAAGAVGTGLAVRKREDDNE
jgi:uncharacterized repeat protein (TIGR02543 family)